MIMTKLPDCATLNRLYNDKFMSYTQIANMYGASRAAVSKKMGRCRIKARSKSEARRAQKK